MDDSATRTRARLRPESEEERARLAPVRRILRVAGFRSCTCRTGGFTVCDGKDGAPFTIRCHSVSGTRDCGAEIEGYARALTAQGWRAEPQYLFGYTLRAWPPARTEHRPWWRAFTFARRSSVRER